MSSFQTALESNTDILPDAPYRGLRFYKTDDANIFAGRSHDAEQCANLLFNTRVMLLHGRTGCGKSSFLRAGLRPFLSARRSSMTFPGGKTGSVTTDDLLVVRSGDLPLRSLARLLYNVVDGLVSGAIEFGILIGDPREALLGRKSLEEFVSEVGTDSARMVTAFDALAASVSGTPILVVDQAEEVFTLAEHGGSQRSFDVKTIDEVKNPDLYRRAFEVQDYFRFLARLAKTKPKIRVIVSLRTEYKGQFEDEILHASGERSLLNIAGYFLPDLDQQGLIEAILCPTGPLRVNGQTINGSERYRFDFQPGVPEKIAADLLSSRPRGGILPVLQVLLLRLWQKTQEASDGAFVHIEETDYKKLGDIENQIDFYLRETFEFALLKRPYLTAEDRNLEPEVDQSRLSARVEQWYSILSEWVSVESDGRVTTKKLTNDEVERLGAKYGVTSHMAMARWLSGDDPGILRQETHQNASGVVQEWTLGHDSIGLAAERARASSRDQVRLIAVGQRDSRKFTKQDLYHEAPEPIELSCPDTLVWSHQVPFYAASRGFFDRLNITIKSDAAMTVDAGMTSYDDLGRIIDGFEASKRVLVAMERTGFPSEEKREAWTDFALPTLFTGYALIGPPGISGHKEKKVPLLSDFRLTPESGRSHAMAKEAHAGLGELLKQLSKKSGAGNKWTIYYYNETARRFIELLCRVLDDKNIDIGNLSLEKMPGGQFSSTDPLAKRLLEAGRDGRSFIVTTATGRALAERNGFVTYADALDLRVFIDAWYSEESFAAKRKELLGDFRLAISHIAWQVNVSHNDAKNKGSEVQEMILRLASVAFYTVEQISASPDDFLGFISDRQVATADRDDFRIDRDVLRRSLERSYNFTRFEDQSRLFLDRTSSLAYDAGSGRNGNNATVTREIYRDLVGLRDKTLVSFYDLNEKLMKLSPEQAEKMKDAIRQAEENKERAWKHFEIMNYVDSAKYMNKAVAAL